MQCGMEKSFYTGRLRTFLSKRRTSYWDELYFYIVIQSIHKLKKKYKYMTLLSQKRCWVMVPACFL